MQPGSAPEVLEEIRIDGYFGEIIFRVVSSEGQYDWSYSIDDGNSFIHFAKTPANQILAHGSYTGAYLGLYSTSNGSSSEAFADFDWIRYSAQER